MSPNPATPLLLVPVPSPLAVEGTGGGAPTREEEMGMPAEKSEGATLAEEVGTCWGGERVAAGGGGVPTLGRVRWVFI